MDRLFRILDEDGARIEQMKSLPLHVLLGLRPRRGAPTTRQQRDPIRDAQAASRVFDSLGKLGAAEQDVGHRSMRPQLCPATPHLFLRRHVARRYTVARHAAKVRKPHELCGVSRYRRGRSRGGGPGGTARGT